MDPFMELWDVHPIWKSKAYRINFKHISIDLKGPSV